MISVVVADAQPVVREGLRAVLRPEQGFEVVGAVDNASDAAELAGRLCPEVVMADVRLPDATGAAVCELIGTASRARILAMGAFPTESLMVGAFTAGASGFLAKDSEPPAIRFAVRSVADGDTYIDPRVAAKYVAVTSSRRSARGPFNLTLQEMRVLEMLPQGLSNREIGAALSVSEPTVKTHLRHAMRKLQARDRTHAAAIALRAGIA